MAFQQAPGGNMRNRGPAPETFGPIADPGTVAGLNIRLQTQNWTDPARTISIVIEEDRGDGVGWRMVFSDTAVAGTIDRNGQLVTAPTWRIGFGTEETGWVRQFQGTLTYGGIVRHSIEYELVSR